MRSLWAEFVSSRAFWVGYVAAGVDFVGCPTLLADQRSLRTEPACGATVTFEFPDDQHLRLVVDGDLRLEVLHADYDQPQLIGTMDCHQMSDAFRWDEFQSIVRYLSTTSEPAWAHQLLLSYFVAVTEECADEHAALLGRCLRASSVFAGPEVEHILAYGRRVAVRRDFRWVNEPDLGWVAEGRDAYSMRHQRGGFDFARFNRFLATLASG